MDKKSLILYRGMIMKELQLMKHQSLQSYELAIPRKHVQILCAVPAICGDDRAG